MQKQKIYGLILFAFVVNLSFASAQGTYMPPTQNFTKLKNFYLSDADKYANEVRQDNELEHNEVGQSANFNSNPLIINGKQLDYSQFSLNSKGLLTVVRGSNNPEIKEATQISFYVSIRRNGKEIVDKKMLFAQKALTQIKLSEIFAFAKDGDLLIIKPVRLEDWKAKRILKLMGGGC
jgi:hypothetical protein